MILYWCSWKCINLIFIQLTNWCFCASWKQNNKLFKPITLSQLIIVFRVFSLLIHLAQKLLQRNHSLLVAINCLYKHFQNGLTEQHENKWKFSLPHLLFFPYNLQEMFLHSSPLTRQIIENNIPTLQQFLLLEMFFKKINFKKCRSYHSFAVCSRILGNAAFTQFKWGNILVLVKKTWPLVRESFWQAVGLYKYVA